MNEEYRKAIQKMFQERRQQSINRKARNRLKSTDLLIKNGIEFVSHNNGAHLVIPLGGPKADFWPGTGKWIVWEVSGERTDGRGVFPLIELVKEKL